jgi:hypothetical protein
MAFELNVKTKDGCKYDCISLGEVMLRLDPGEGRIKTARSFRAWEGGGEYNVSRGLRKCFGMDVAVVTAFADNEIGRLVEDFIMQGGVDVSLIKWIPYDGIGRSVRNGLNFTERGFGVRGAVGVSLHLRQIGQPLAAYRRHLRRSLRDHPGRCAGSGPESKKIRHHGLLRPELPPVPLEGHRRPG